MRADAQHDPTLRLFARNTGSPLLLLGVDVIVRSGLGSLTVVPVGEIAATATWAPTQPLALVAYFLPLLARGPYADRAAVQAARRGRELAVDDVYVDPYHK